MNGAIIDPVKETKILGIIIDHKLDYRPHIKYAIAKATRINRAVTGIAQPIMSYGALITGRAVKYQHIQKILRQMVTPMAQQAVKAYRSSSYISVTALADFPPIELFMDSEQQ
ncbi:hypothetical protein DERF_002673 [Dermatophagoides farinae]|uniref:Uncharacterized protein n=1 Tax=Dermatophagoides farinae TaxID=6954 RepID=A0A922IB40_DERFA|nr:hypothetical protein DERF_002673 [Dermatophagoides farinae]